MPQQGWNKAHERRLSSSTIYAVEACPYNVSERATWLAIVSGPSLFKCRLDNKTQQLEQRAEYVVRGKSQRPTDEVADFYACAWLWLSDGALVIVVGGAGGAIHLIDATTMCRARLLYGHGAAVNDFATCHAHRDLLLSASADESIRLTNARTGAPLAAFFADRGHLAEVLSVSWHPTKPWLLASASLDNAVMIWSLAQVLENAEDYTQHKHSSDADFPFVHVCQPLFHAAAVHNDYVDGVAWFGDALCTKSVHNEALIWAPHGSLEDTLSLGTALTGGHTVLRRLPAPGAGVWFLKFDLNLAAGALACGSTAGRAHLWSLPGLEDRAKPIRKHSSVRVAAGKEQCTVRSVAVISSSTFVAGTDDGRLIVMHHTTQSSAAKAAQKGEATGSALGSAAKGGSACTSGELDSSGAAVSVGQQPAATPLQPARRSAPGAGMLS